MLLLLYDPVMLALSKVNLSFFIAAGDHSRRRGGYRFRRAQRQVPQRERGLPQRQDMGFPIVAWKIGRDRADWNALWKSVPLVGQKLEPGRELVGFSITDADAEATRRFEQSAPSTTWQ
jgi:hypothetical protein